MSALEIIVQNYFLGLDVKENAFFGHIDGTKEFERFRDELRAIGYMFVIRQTNQNRTALLFSHARKSDKIKIPFFGPLFQITKTVSYECSLGTSRSHKKKDSGDLGPLLKKRIRKTLSKTKKIGCLATMHVTQLTIYPEFAISSYNAHGAEYQTQVKRTLVETLRQIKSSHSQPVRPPTMISRYRIKISREAVHSHSLTISSASQPLHPKLAAEIRRLALDRSMTVFDIRVHLEACVMKMIQETKCIAPNRQNRCFYPTNQMIYHHMHYTNRALNKNQSNLKALDKYIKTCEFPECTEEVVEDKSAGKEEGLLLVNEQTTRNADPIDSRTVSGSFIQNERLKLSYKAINNTVLAKVQVPKSLDNTNRLSNPVSLIKVKITTPKLLPISAPIENRIPKLTAMSQNPKDELDLLKLQGEIWTLLQQARDEVYLMDNVKCLEAAKAHFLAGKNVLKRGNSSETVTVFLRSSRPEETQNNSFGS